MRNFQESFIFILVVFLITVFLGSFLIFEIEKTKIEIEKISLAQIRTPSLKSRPITLMFVGDIMLDRGVEYMIEKYGKGDYRFPFLKIRDYLQKADILFGNLESVISDKGRKVGSIYSFRAKPEAVEGLTFTGFNVISVANNHIFDYGREAMEDSFKRLKEVGIDYVGGGFSEMEARSGVIKEINNTKIVFLAYTNPGTPYWSASKEKSGIAWLNEENLRKDIFATRQKADLVIVSLHFGEEYKKEPNSAQKYWAHLAIDSGADLVIGHHSHVIQPIEKYPEKKSEISNGVGKQGYIAYSLGNFIFDQGFSEETMQGLLLEVLIENGKIKEVIPKGVKINEFFQPEIK